MLQYKWKYLRKNVNLRVSKKIHLRDHPTMHSYFSTSHGKPGIVAVLSSATSWIGTHQEPGIPGSWITRMMLIPSVDNQPEGSRVQATSCARRQCSQIQSSHCNTVSLNEWIYVIEYLCSCLHFLLEARKNQKSDQLFIYSKKNC
jgi:hypothetical protein